jgi:hypothetical protein
MSDYIYANNDAPTIWKRTMRLRQVIDANQGFIGVQQAWESDKGQTDWRWIESTNMQALHAEAGLNATPASGSLDRPT